MLSSFVHWPEHRLAGLLFHELTHQRVYVDDDTAFNESLATAVQQAGTELWLATQADAGEIARYRAWVGYRAAVIDLIGATRARLDELYASALADAAKRERKQALLGVARAAHSRLTAEHGIVGGYTRFFADGLNNARLGSVSAYHSRSTAFRRMLDGLGLDFAAFFAHVEAIGKLEPRAREACLDAWDSPDRSTIRSRCPALPPGITASA